MSHSRRPYLRTFVTFALLAVGGTLGLALLLDWNAWVAWFAAANSVAIATWGWDKWMARRQAARIPEATLHSMALVGTSPASLAGMALFRHKIRDWKFSVLHVVLLIAQAGLLYRFGPEGIRAWFLR